MHNISELIKEPIFKETMIGLRHASTEVERNKILDRQLKQEEMLTTEEKEAKRKQLFSDFDLIFKTVDADIDEMKAERIQNVFPLGRQIVFRKTRTQ